MMLDGLGMPFISGAKKQNICPYFVPELDFRVFPKYCATLILCYEKNSIEFSLFLLESNTV